MLISNNTLRSDPRVMCGMIAQSTLARLDNDDRPDAVTIHALTLIRMLDAYRVGMAPVQAHSGVAEYSPLSREKAGFEMPNHEGEVMQAIDNARQSICRLDREEFSISLVKTLVAAFNVNGTTSIVTNDDKQLLKGFLGQFSNELQKSK